MNLVNLSGVSAAFGTRQVLDEVSLGVSAGERIGVVGRNGAGKSTLVRILAGVQQPDAGRVTHTGGLRVGVLSQSDDLDPTASIRETVAGGRHDHVLAGDPAVRAVLSTLLGPAYDARTATIADDPVGTLSGGERRRVALAAQLTRELDLLVLDEPTNHLDIEGVAALAGLLTARRSALVVVTHDRWFLDEVCRSTWEVSDGLVHAYEGGYAAYVLARAERDRTAATAAQRRRNQLRTELAWLRRGPPARTSKPKFRIDAANALIADVPPPRDSTELVRIAGARLGKVVVELEDVSVTVPGTLGEGQAQARALLDHVTWNLGPGERVAILGPNGAGKTTLLDILAGECELPVEGHVTRGRTVRLARLTQQDAVVDGSRRVLQAVQDVAVSIELADGREITAAQLLERLGFSRERQWVPVADLSGGERRRLQMLRTLLAGPNVLLLDEPTNDLDTETLAALEDVLDGWPGTLVVVSHDRYFVERTTDDQWALFGDGALIHLPGGVEEYLGGRADRGDQAASSGQPRQPTPPSAPAAASAVGQPGAASPVTAAPAAAQGGPAAKDIRTAKKEAARWERVLGRLSERERRLHEEMASAASDHEALRRLDDDLRVLHLERDAAEEAWLAAAEVAEGRTG